ncbi:hypothetical protein G4L39_08950 [Limisphaera ngatamarikiensis]|jgi:hypothetical protein|uniref:3-keto-alpha-glucoside-1,2-lyase/3-keto-2-hydroxy-glucal hydratase domain-containing protein n=1 Tax=Limisphaera ngatamarikiensis TaxID=1324935 RepID=A0A6M1RXP6_9BACT|nr:family 16 glycoside hydrolase [Limisphaera ngatamarikiensis]NGO39522.1 hypothetical protein [Limisphaera ngatamarikiensis]
MLGWWMVCLGVLCCGLGFVRGAELAFDFGPTQVDRVPEGFRSLLAGGGAPGEWRVIWDEVPSELPPLSEKAPVVSRRTVLAQLSEDGTDERFPLLVYEPLVFGDFTFTTRFKTVRGQRERMAGVVFRLQDERNFYVVRASSLGNTFRFYKVLDGQRGPLIGPEVEVPSGVWHELTVECRGNQIRCLLNGRELIPPLTDPSFARGRIGFWTKSDSVSYFADARVVYTPLEPPAQRLVEEVLRRYPRVLDLRIYVPRREGSELVVVGARDRAALGEPGGSTEAKVLAEGRPYYVPRKDAAVVVAPLRDRNGDPVGVVRIWLERRPGQTAEAALARAQPILRQLQDQVKYRADLAE